MAPLAALIARLKRAKLIVQMHGIEAWPRPSRLQTRGGRGRRSRPVRLALYALRVFSIGPLSRRSGSSCVPNTVGEAFTPGDGSALRAMGP